MPENREAAEREKNLVALTSVAAAVFLTSIKFIVGLSTGSLGILSEAAHSLLDLVAAVVTLGAVRISGRPADLNHPYGHGKFENISALFETALLLVTCVWIIYEGVQRLFYETVHVEATFWAFAVIAVSIVVDISRSRALMRTAKKYKSQALEADALHFSTDVWSSCVVLAGLFSVYLAHRLGLPQLMKADALAALGVAGIVVYVSLQLGGRTVSVLTDAVPVSVSEDIRCAVQNVAGVEEVQRVRVRQSGPEIFADISIKVEEDASLEKARNISAKARSAIHEVYPGADVVLEVNPAELSESRLLAAIRLIAARHELGAHGIRLLKEEGRNLLELHLEVDETLSVESAHTKVSDFEKALRQAIPFIDVIVSHIEPIGESSAAKQTRPVTEDKIFRAIGELKNEVGFDVHPHEVRMYHTDGEISLSFHCVVAPTTGITAAHDLTVKLEQAIRGKIPEVGRIVIHVEPPE